MPKKITEEDGTHKAWMSRAKDMTLADLPEFLRELTEDYQHDYGTICHAIAAASIAAAYAVEKSPQGGITGFQAGCIGWAMLSGWGAPSTGEIGARIINYDDLLFPQNVSSMLELSADTLAALQKKAAAKVASAEDYVSPAVLAHWQALADGAIPDGFRAAA